MMLRVVRRFTGGEQGIAAIEFAAILPIMLFLLFGSVEISNLLSLSRRTTSVASTMADLVGQSKTITDKNMTDIFSAAQAILSPFDYQGSKIVVSSIYVDNNHRKVRWSETQRGTARVKDSTVDDLVSDKVAPAGTTVIMAEVSYSYKVAGGYYEFLNDPITLKDTFFVRPRRTTEVARVP